MSSFRRLAFFVLSLFFHPFYHLYALSLSNSDHSTLGIPSSPSPATLTVTAVTNHGDPPYTAQIQCWSLQDKFSTYPTVGRALALGAVDNATYVVLPPRSGEGWHRPPHPMLFVLLSGVAQVYTPRLQGPSDADDLSGAGSDIQLTGQAEGPLPQRRPHKPPHPELPDDTQDWDTFTIVPGSGHQMLIAADMDSRAPGHLTFYPSDLETVALQIPFRHGELPGHKLLHEGPCLFDA